MTTNTTATARWAKIGLTGCTLSHHQVSRALGRYARAEEVRTANDNHAHEITALLPAGYKVDRTGSVHTTHPYSAEDFHRITNLIYAAHNALLAP